MTRYFHGGPAGLAPGELVLPPAVSGAETHSGGDPAKVYVTTNRALAELFAALRKPAGSLYVVEPAGELAGDPDLGESWTCEAARVLIVRDREVILTGGELERRLRRVCRPRRAGTGR